jgi:hypothetical protein
VLGSRQPSVSPLSSSAAGGSNPFGWVWSRLSRGPAAHRGRARNYTNETTSETKKRRNTACSLDLPRTTNPSAPMGVSPGELRITSESSGLRHLTAAARCHLRRLRWRWLGAVAEWRAGKTDWGMAVSAGEMPPGRSTCHAGAPSLTAVDRCSGHAVTGIRLCGRVT